METSIHKMSLEINDNADFIKRRLSSSQQEAIEFIEVCESSGFKGQIVITETGQTVHWRDCPDDMIKSIAVKLFDLYRKRLMN